MKYVDQFLKILAETDYNAFVRKEWFLFCTINIFLPFMWIGFITSISFWNIIFLMNYMFAALILIANIYRIKNAKELKKSYQTITVLNILSFFLGGGICFASSLFSWPLAIQSYHAMIRGYETITPLY